MVPDDNLHLSHNLQRSGSDIRGIGTQFGEMPGIFLYQEWNYKGMVIRVDSECAHHSYRPLLEVRSHHKRCKVSDNDMTTWSTMVSHVGGGGELEMHGFGGVIPRHTTYMYPIPGMRRWNDC